MLLLAFLEAFFFIAISKGIEEFTDPIPELFYFVKVLNAGLGLNAILILIIGFISFVILISVSERIRLFIDIERNTRKINNNIEKISQLLERKFNLKTIEVKEEESIIDKINYWGQAAPIIFSILFFIYILNELPSGTRVNSENLNENLGSDSSRTNIATVDRAVSFVNETDNYIFIAIAYYDNKLFDWKSNGWFVIKPFKKIDIILPEYFTGNEVYYYGQKVDENDFIEGIYEGSDGFFYIKQKNNFDFLEKNTKNEEKIGFKKITSSNNKFTCNLGE